MNPYAIIDPETEARLNPGKYDHDEDAYERMMSTHDEVMSNHHRSCDEGEPYNPDGCLADDDDTREPNDVW